MKKHVLKTLMMALFVSYLSCIAMAQEQNTERIIPLVEHCVIPVGSLYRMPIKEYSSKMVDHVSGKKRYVIRYESDNASVVKANGNTFVAKSVGTAQLTMTAYKAVPGTNDQADLTAPIGKATFTVEVKQEVPLVMPPIDLPWGSSRELITPLLTEKGSKLFTSTYWDMHPNVSEEYRVGIEAFLNQNMDFPVTLLTFNSRNQLYRKTLIASSWERLKVPKVSAVWKWLKEQGFEDRGINVGSNMWEMYHTPTQTLATVGYLAFQSTLYMYVDFLYDNKEINAVETIETHQNIELELSQKGHDVTIVHPQREKGEVLVFNSFGERVVERQLVNGKCELPNLPSGLLFVVVTGAKPVKVFIPTH